MSSIQDAPRALGDYMLKGWVLTNRRCPTPGCTIPLLRSPDRQSPAVHLCVNCDEKTTGPCQPSPAQVSQHDLSTATSSASQITRTSTPATEVSEASDGLPPFVETEEIRRRREQTDRASAEIGRRLLQGWTMLGDECPNGDCYYVPLVRPPKSSLAGEQKKECVLCGNIYITERDWAGREQLIRANPQPPQVASSSVNLHTSPPTAVAPSQQNPLTRSTPRVVDANRNPQLHSINPMSNVEAGSLMGALSSSAEALQFSLQNLTARMTSLASNSSLADPASIATTANAIYKVTQALSQVKQLQWGEAQAHVMS